MASVAVATPQLVNAQMICLSWTNWVLPYQNNSNVVGAVFTHANLFSANAVWYCLPSAHCVFYHP